MIACGLVAGLQETGRAKWVISVRKKDFMVAPLGHLAVSGKRRGQCFVWCDVDSFTGCYGERVAAHSVHKETDGESGRLGSVFGQSGWWLRLTDQAVPIWTFLELFSSRLSVMFMGGIEPNSIFAPSDLVWLIAIRPHLDFQAHAKHGAVRLKKQH